uniref:CARD caspase 2 n=1 Tax=Hydra vulgaris TaxID=6087 RepID=D1MAR5_HYDVU|nr:CARD caspase 2 [Hydra vulgaris]
MEAIHREILRKNRMSLSHSNMNTEEVCTCLIRDNVFTINDKYSVESYSSPVKKIEKLLDILSHKGANAFSTFTNVLNELKLFHLSKLISTDKNANITNQSRQSEEINVSNDDLEYSSCKHARLQEESLKEEKESDVSNGVQTKPQDKSLKEEKESEVSDSYDALDGPINKPDVKEDNHGIDNEEDGRMAFLSNIRSAPKFSNPNDFVAPVDNIQHNLEECYAMNTNPRGLFILVNNKKFLPSSGMHEYTRNGTDEDAKCMKELFEELGYVIESYQNISVYEMRKIFKKASLINYSGYSALAVCILSHGQEGVVYGIDGTIDIKEITGFFRGSNLMGKPKMFFFQACQGSDYMDGVEPDTGRMETDGPPEYGNEISLPTEADFIYAYSTVPGFYSWRNSAKGSWFIQALVEVFRKHAHKMDVVRMLTRVNRIVATKKSQTGQLSSHNKRQISSIVSQLRKDLFLCPPNGPLRSLDFV